MGIRDTRLMARALTQRWPLSSDQRQEIVEILLSVAKDVSNSPRERTSAAKALMSAEAQNQSDEHKVLDVEHATARDTQLSAIAADLGIDPCLIIDAAIETNRSVEGIEEPAAIERRR